MNPVTQAADHFESIYRSGGWTEVGVRSVFESCSAEEASSHPLPGRHSAWELLLHLDACHRAVTRQLGGEVVHFSVDEGVLGFADLAVEGGLERAADTAYRFQLLDGEGRAVGVAQTLESGDLEPVGVDLIAAGAPKKLHRTVSVKGQPQVSRKLFLPLPGDLEEGRFHGYEIHTRRGEGKWRQYTRVYFYKWDDGHLQRVRVERGE